MALLVILLVTVAGAQSPDLDGDGYVGFTDFLEFSRWYGRELPESKLWKLPSEGFYYLRTVDRRHANDEWIGHGALALHNGFYVMYISTWKLNSSDKPTILAESGTFEWRHSHRRGYPDTMRVSGSRQIPVWWAKYSWGNSPPVLHTRVDSFLVRWTKADTDTGRMK